MKHEHSATLPMHTFEFRVRCADKNESCDTVKSFMTDFTIRNADDGELHDHIGIKDFQSPSLAVKRSRELRKLAGKKIKNLIIVKTT
ncbi:MAG: hypothetical protein EB829_03750 [Nitrosopumilus sp. H8]|nr:MAG: hypothetical protein EB829_03750 [Nitrosopumilus sp. H8]